jgi:hypothetical protein
MSHTEILDKIRQRFVNLPSAGLGSQASWKSPHTCKSHNENRQESDFNCKALVNVSAEMIPEFFEKTDML